MTKPRKFLSRKVLLNLNIFNPQIFWLATQHVVSMLDGGQTCFEQEYDQVIVTYRAGKENPNTDALAR